MSGAENQQERQAPLSKEYVAGILTGEGYFGLSIVKKPRQLGLRNGFVIQPRFALHMNDEETMKLVIESFAIWSIPYWEEPPTKVNGRRISSAGCKSVTRIAHEFLPFLTGTKKRAASIVIEFGERRMAAPTSRYGDEEIRLCNLLRTVNGGNFKRKRLLESSETSTPDSLKKLKIQSELHGDV